MSLKDLLIVKGGNIEKFEIILIDFEKKDLANFVDRELNLKNENIKNSHFFDSKSNQDLEFENVHIDIVD